MSGGENYRSNEERDTAAKLDTQENQKKRRDMNPLFYCKLIAHHPRKAFFMTLGCHLLMMITSGILLVAGYDLLPVYMDDLPVHLHNQPWQGRVHAFLEKTTYPGYYDRNPAGGFRVQPSPLANIELFYKMNDNKNVFTKENLELMERLENELISVPLYEKYCQLDLRTRNCTKPTSILRYFDGTYQKLSPDFYDPNFERIEDVLGVAANHPVTKIRFPFFLGTGSYVNGSTAFSSITRSVIPFGYPMKEYLDNEIDYRRFTGEYQGLNIEPICEKYLTKDGDDFQFTYRSQLMWFYFTRTQAMTDILWAGASIGFIFFLMLFHTRSLWITFFAVMSVIASFVTTNLIYNLVMQFHYLGFFHVLSIFIILGIGADNFFVFYDVWRNTGCEVYISVAHRLSDTYRKSAISMLFTSLTTSVAFFSNAISPLLATRSFGVFAGTVVIVNYLSAILFFPTVVLMYHNYFEGFQWPCIRCCLSCCKKKSDTKAARYKSYIQSMSRPDQTSDQHYMQNGIEKDTEGKPNRHSSKMANIDELKQTMTIYKTDIQKSSENNKEVYVIKHDFVDKQYDSVFVNDSYIADKEQLNTTTSNGSGAGFTSSNGGYEQNGFGGRSSHVNGEIKQSDDDHGVVSITRAYRGLSQTKQQKKPLMARFFRDKYFRFVTNKYIRWIILLCMAGILGFFIYHASKLKADNELFGVLPADHHYEIALRHRLESFVASYGDETLALFIMWGLKQNNMDGCHFSEPECDGRLVTDDTFDPNPVANQIALQQLCETLQNMDDGRAELLRLRKSPETGKYEIKCFIQNLDDFLQTDPSINGQMDFPYSKEKIAQFMMDRPEFYNVTQLDQNFTNYLEIPISYWLSDRYTYNVTDDFTDFDPLIGEERGSYSVPLNSDTSKYYGNKLRYVTIEVNTTIKFRVMGHEEGIPVRDEWEQFMLEQAALMPNGLKSFFQTDSRFRWHWLSVQEMLIQNAIYGIVISVCLAFPILVIATGNIIVGTLATFSLCCCTACVIGVIPLGGWGLGALESLNMCMVVGLSVDYVVHLAQAYSASLHPDRLSRVQDMLDEMATSVFFGAITTLGAAMFMFFTMLTFFKQFGVFMFSTIGFSLLFSMGMFTTLMGIVGPQNDVGNLAVFFRKCCGKRNR